MSLSVGDSISEVYLTLNITIGAVFVESGYGNCWLLFF